jgi:hypothetical protein
MDKSNAVRRNTRLRGGSCTRRRRVFAYVVVRTNENTSFDRFDLTVYLYNITSNTDFFVFLFRNICDGDKCRRCFTTRL